MNTNKTKLTKASKDFLEYVAKHGRSPSNRAGWSRAFTYAKRGILAHPKRGVYRLTRKGNALLRSAKN